MKRKLLLSLTFMSLTLPPTFAQEAHTKGNGGHVLQCDIDGDGDIDTALLDRYEANKHRRFLNTQSSIYSEQVDEISQRVKSKLNQRCRG